MKRIVLFWFHSHFEVCIKRVSELKTLNPTVPIFGLFGGDSKQLSTIPNLLRQQLEGIHHLDLEPQFRWRFGATEGLFAWYEKVGILLDFDMLHLVEWDLLLTAPLEKVFSHVPGNAVALTALTPIANGISDWVWMKSRPYKKDFHKLLAFVRSKYQKDIVAYASLGPGVCLPHIFFERLQHIRLPFTCHDEIRLPLYAQLADLKLVDTEFLPTWKKYGKLSKCLPRFIASSPFSGYKRSPVHKWLVDYKNFNCDKFDVPEKILRDLSNGKSRQVAFHPVRSGHCY